MMKIKGRPGYYVTEEGRIFTSTRRVGLGWGSGSKILIDGSLREVKPYKSRRYWYVRLWFKGKVKIASVHGLVLKHYRRPRRKGQQGRHLDGNPDHNWLANLKWGTQAQNQADRILHGTSSRGSQNGNNKLVEAQVKIIKSQIKGQRSAGAASCQSRLAKEFRVTRRTIRDIWRGRTWGWL